MLLFQYNWVTGYTGMALETLKIFILFFSFSDHLYLLGTTFLEKWHIIFKSIKICDGHPTLLTICIHLAVFSALEWPPQKWTQRDFFLYIYRLLLHHKLWYGTLVKKHCSLQKRIFPDLKKKKNRTKGIGGHFELFWKNLEFHVDPS